MFAHVQAQLDMNNTNTNPGVRLWEGRRVI